MDGGVLLVHWMAFGTEVKTMQIRNRIQELKMLRASELDVHFINSPPDFFGLVFWRGKRNSGVYSIETSGTAF
jgi:hypothetical protein